MMMMMTVTISRHALMQTDIQTVTHTDRPRYSVRSNRPRTLLCMQCGLKINNMTLKLN